MTYNFRTHAVVIHSAYDANLLEDVVQAQRYVLALLKLDQEEDIKPGDLHGMSLMLKNAERTLAEACAALPSLKRNPETDSPALHSQTNSPPLAKAA